MGPYQVQKQAPTPSTPFEDDMEGICARNKQSNTIGKRFGQYKRKQSQNIEIKNRREKVVCQN